MSLDPEIDRIERTAAFGDEIGDAELLIELERACLHGERARCRAWFGRGVDDADADTQAREEQREHEARGPRAGDEHLGIAVAVVPSYASSGSRCCLRCCLRACEPVCEEWIAQSPLHASLSAGVRRRIRE